LLRRLKFVNVVSYLTYSISLRCDEYLTAEEYLPGNPNAKYLYTYKIGRRCDGENCYKVPGPGLKAHGIELDQPIFIVLRLYLEKATRVGPPKYEILWDRAIKFSPKQ